MTKTGPFSAALLVAGATATAAAVLWWALTFWQVWSYDYLSLTQASKCLIADSTICRLATALCTGQHRAIVALYSPLMLWVGVAAFYCGLWSRALAPPS